MGGKNSKIENWACDENCALHTKIVHTLRHFLAISKRLEYSQNYLNIFLATKNLSKKDQYLTAIKCFLTRTSISAKKYTILAIFLIFDQSFRHSKQMRYMNLEATCQHTHTKYS